MPTVTRPKSLQGEDSQKIVNNYLSNPTADNKEAVRKTFHQLVVNTAKAYQAHDDLEDLIGEAYFGLFEALDKYNPTTGYAFSTYAVPYMRGMIMHRLNRRKHHIRMPAWVIEFYRSESKAIARLRTETKPLTDENIAEEMGLSIQRYLHVTSRNTRYIFQSVEELIQTSEQHDTNGVMIPEALTTNYRGCSHDDLDVIELFHSLFHDCVGKSVMKIAQIHRCDMITAREIHELVHASH